MERHLRCVYTAVLLVALCVEMALGRPTPATPVSDSVHVRSTDDTTSAGRSEDDVDLGPPSVYNVFSRQDAATGDDGDSREKVVPDDDNQSRAPVDSRTAQGYATLRRRRRSSIGWVHAAIRMCDTGRNPDRRCRRVEAEDKRQRMRIQLADQ